MTEEKLDRPQDSCGIILTYRRDSASAFNQAPFATGSPRWNAAKSLSRDVFKIGQR